MSDSNENLRQKLAGKELIGFTRREDRAVQMLDRATSAKITKPPAPSGIVERATSAKIGKPARPEA